MILDNISYNDDNITLENNSITYSYDDDDDYSSLEYDSNWSLYILLYRSNANGDAGYNLKNKSIDYRKYSSLYFESEYISLYMEVLQYDGYRKKYIIDEQEIRYHMIKLSYIKNSFFNGNAVLSYRIYHTE